MRVAWARGRRARWPVAILGVVTLVGSVGVGLAAAGLLSAGRSREGVRALPLPSRVSVSVTVSRTPGASAGASQPASWPPPVVAIPDTVMLTSRDLGGVAVMASDPAYWRRGTSIRPRPCAGAEYPSDTDRTAERAMVADMPPANGGRWSDGVVQYVAAYDRDGARRFMAELMTAVTATCRENCWRTRGDVGVGEESLLLQCALMGGFAGDVPPDRFVAAVRVGRAIVLIGSLGNMAQRGDLDRARTLAQIVTPRLGPIA